MKAALDCLECVVKQALRAARTATGDPAVQRQIVDEVTKRIPALDLNDSPAWVSQSAYELAAELSGNADPFQQLRREQNEQAMALLPDMRALVAESDDRLDAALHLAAAGNVIDLGTMMLQDIDMHAAIEHAMHHRFAVNHMDAFRESLEKADDLLFLLDNAGEIVFDMVLIEELQKHTSVTAVVKAGPIINDAIMADVEQIGLTSLCEIIDNGGAFIGSPLKHIPARFRARMDAADMIVGKGQGNYETVDDYPGDVFLILKAKCEIVAGHMGVEYGQLGLISTQRRAAQQQMAVGTPAD